MRLRSLAGCAIAGFLIASVGAQTTWIVDAQNRPGTQFTDLPAAVAAAADGDVLRVRDGDYTGFDTSKGLFVLGQVGANVRDPAPGTPADVGVRIQNLPAGRTFVFKGFRWTGVAGPQLVVEACAGLVFLEDLQWGVPGNVFSRNEPGIHVSASPQVSVTDSRLLGGPPLRATAGSSLTLTDVEARGNDGCLGHCFIQPSEPALEVADSNAVLSRCRMTGGGSTFGSIAAPVAALTGTNADFVITGDGTGWLRGGTAFGSASAVAGANVTVRIHPDVPVLPGGGAPPFGPGVTHVLVPTPSLRAEGTPLGGIASFDLYSPPGDDIFFLAGVPGPRVTFPGFGDLYLDPSSAVIASQGVQPASGRSGFTIPVPNATSLIGATLTWQGLSGQLGGAMRLSNPASYTHDG